MRPGGRRAEDVPSPTPMGRPEELANEPERASGLAPSHVSSRPVPIGERETTPAPPSTESPMGEHGGLRLRSPFAASPSTVPFRTAAVVPDDLDLRLAFVLLHVDGAADLEAIAQLVALPSEDLQARFLELVAMGLVDLRAG